MKVSISHSKATYEEGDWIPYGSTYVQTPSGWIVEELDAQVEDTCDDEELKGEERFLSREDVLFELSQNPISLDAQGGGFVEVRITDIKKAYDTPAARYWTVTDWEIY